MNANGHRRYINEGILMSAIRDHAGDDWPQQIEYASPDANTLVFTLSGKGKKRETYRLRRA